MRACSFWVGGWAGGVGSVGLAQCGMRGRLEEGTNPPHTNTHKPIPPPHTHTQPLYLEQVVARVVRAVSPQRELDARVYTYDSYTSMPTISTRRHI